jgi:hypothetical protein
MLFECCIFHIFNYYNRKYEYGEEVRKENLAESIRIIQCIS